MSTRIDRPELPLTLVSLHRYVEAEAEARRRLAQDPEDPLNLRALTLALNGQQRHSEAVEAASRLVRAAPDQGVAHHTFGMVLLDADQPRAAVRSANAELGLEADSPGAHQLAAVAYRRAGNLAKAREHAERAVELAPTATSLTNLADVARVAGNAGEAEILYRRAIAIDPLSAVALNNLGVLLSSQGRHREAEVLFTNAGRLDPRLQQAPANVVLTAKRRLSLASARGGKMPAWRFSASVVVLWGLLRAIFGSDSPVPAVVALLAIGWYGVASVVAARQEKATMSASTTSLLRDNGWRARLQPRALHRSLAALVRAPAVIVASTSLVVLAPIYYFTGSSALSALGNAMVLGLFIGVLTLGLRPWWRRLRLGLIRRGWWPAPR